MSGSTWEGWLWPVPAWIDDRDPVVTDGYSNIKTPRHRRHLGVDLMYPRHPGDEAPFPWGSRGYVAPVGTLVIAAGPGRIRYAGLSPKGHDVIIDHGSVGGEEMRTYYQHLLAFARPWKVGDVVRAGEYLGPMGGDIQAGGYPLHHLHFEVRFPDFRHTRDPLPYLRRWKILGLQGPRDPEGSPRS